MSEVNQAIQEATLRRAVIVESCNEGFKTLAPKDLQDVSDDVRRSIIALMSTAMELGFQNGLKSGKETK